MSITTSLEFPFKDNKKDSLIMIILCNPDSSLIYRLRKFKMITDSQKIVATKIANIHKEVQNNLTVKYIQTIYWGEQKDN